MKIRSLLTLLLALSGVVATLTFNACGGLPKPKRIDFVVREQPGKLVHQSVSYRYWNGKDSVRKSSNAIGYFHIYKSDLHGSTNFSNLRVTVTWRKDSTAAPVERTLRTNIFSCYYDFYMQPIVRVPDSLRVADMHYHVSMRPHNAFGNDVYYSGSPDNFNWLMVGSHLKVFTGHGWKQSSLTADFDDATERSQMKTFLGRTWIQPKKGSNHLKHFSEATLPHMVEGNVTLAFNAISPYEHSLSMGFVKQAVSSLFKSGADKRWLNMIGRPNNHITHWENFQKEFGMISNQDTAFNNYSWRNLLKEDDIKTKVDGLPLVVNVVEGGHILQDKYFPHSINYDLMDTTDHRRQRLFSQIKEVAEATNDTKVLAKLSAANTTQKKNAAVEDVLMTEILGNVDALKQMNIYMLSISHLSYNGMAGHAPALDVSRKPFLERMLSGVVKRAYGIRVSNDRQYKRSFDGLFFRVPGVNKFGDSVISRLLDYSKGKRVMHIDLKHADVLTRKFVLQKYKSESVKLQAKLRPICSHCAVNGLSIDYTSPLLNEYSLRNSSLARKFYPFAINLYNEEVRIICENDGMIGIPLEERVLGGYINNRQDWLYTFSDSTYYAAARPKREKRFSYYKEIVRYLSYKDTVYYPKVKQFYREKLDLDSIQGIDDQELSDLVCDDYLSAEPFLQNLFHIIDIADTVRQKEWMDSLILAVQPDVVEQVRQRAASQTPGVADSVSVITERRLKELPIELLDTAVISNFRRYYQRETYIAVVDTIIQKRKYQFEIHIKTERAANHLADSLHLLPENQYRRKMERWKNVCFGSDFDGMIDPVDICPSASQYPMFREKLKVLIPMFIHVRHTFEIRDKLIGEYRNGDFYFDSKKGATHFTVDQALQMLFYSNLKEFTINNFRI